jgi:arginine repressor
MFPILIAFGQDEIKELLYKENIEEHAANLLRKSIKLGIIKTGKMTKNIHYFIHPPQIP